jgi:hypothetical protein
MKSTAIVLMLLLISPPLTAQSRPARRSGSAAQRAPALAAAQSLPLRRVILYSNGVAYFERRGKVTGRAEINLSFKQSQVDDVLKSLVVLDLGRGRIGAVSYNSSAPPSARLTEIPFSIEAGTAGDEWGGLAGVLRQLQGARVAVMATNRTAIGAILTVEERESQIDAHKPPAVRHTLVIASESGELQNFDLAEVRSVKLIDEGARRGITEFANATASARRRDAKTIVVSSDGEGPREMVISYTISAPIWKTTYRVVLDAAGKPFFQGWAIVDNVSEEDWADVSLSLVSGTPVSFIQPMQKPLYRYRPVIPIPDDLKLSPQVYELDEELGLSKGNLPGASLTGTGIGPGEGRNTGGGSFGLGGGGGVGEGRGSGVGAGVGSGVGPHQQLTANVSGFSTPTTSLSDAITSQDSGVKAAATGNEVGDLFEYRIDQPVTVRRDRSALIPILQTKLEGERVSIYHEAAHKDRPMSGLRLKNISTLTLEGGSLTVLDGDAYAGEALIERLKPGEQRFISFALDLGTLVAARAKGDREPVFLVRAVNGVFQAHYYQAERKTYTITNQTDHPRVVYIEHPARQDWMLADEAPKPASKTASLYRFRVEVGPRTTIELPIAERRALMDSYALSNLTLRDLELFVARRYIDQTAHAALEKVVDLKSRIATIDARIAAVDREAKEIGEDQERLRQNIKALKETAEARQLIVRYVAKAGEQETRIEQLAKARRAAADERVRLQVELEAAIRAFALDRRL